MLVKQWTNLNMPQHIHGEKENLYKQIGEVKMAKELVEKTVGKKKYHLEYSGDNSGFANNLAYGWIYRGWDVLEETHKGKNGTIHEVWVRRTRGSKGY
jgi:hypothetical protein